MALTYHDSTQQSVTSTANIAVPKPTLDDGDTVIIFVATRGATLSLTTPFAGFTQLSGAEGATSTTGSGARVFAYWKYVATASGEPSTYNAVGSTSINGSVVAVSVSGGGPSPIQDAAYLADGSGSDATVVAPSVQATTDDTLVLTLAVMNTSSGVASWAPPGGVTEVEDVATVAASNRASCALGFKTQAVEGPTGTASWVATLVDGTAYGPAAGVTVVLGAPAVAANAGGDQTVDPGQVVTLDGGASTGAIVSRSWAQDPGDAIDVTGWLDGATSEVATFVAPKPSGSSPMALHFTHEVNGADNTDDDALVITVRLPGEVSGGGLGRYKLGADGLRA